MFFLNCGVLIGYFSFATNSSSVIFSSVFNEESTQLYPTPSLNCSFCLHKTLLGRYIGVLPSFK